MDAKERERRQKAALDWINSHWAEPGKKCPICKQSQWAVGTVFESREFEGGNLVLGGDSNLIPAFPLTCQVCGHIYWFNGVVAGIIQPATSNDDDQVQDDSGEPR